MPFCRTNVKKIGHPLVAKVPPVATGGEANPSKKRKGDAVKAPVEGANKRKEGASNADTKGPVDGSVEAPIGAAAPVEAADVTGSQLGESTAVVGVSAPRTSAPAVTAMIFPCFVAKASAVVTGTRSPPVPEVINGDAGQRCGRTLFVLPSVDTVELHNMLGASI